jgi:phosphinothricin acetyltransferase
MIVIRPATFSDLPQILQIINYEIAHSTAIYDLEPWPQDKIEQWFAEKQEQGHPLLIAETAGQVVAYTTYGTFRHKAGYRHTVEHSVYVASGKEGKGTGRALMNELINEAQQAGVHVMIGGMDAENRESIRFHEKLGFIEVGRLKEVGRKFDRWLDLVFMQKIIGETYNGGG